MNRLWARLMRPWREAAAIIAEAETAGWRKHPAREITFPPVPPAPGPPWDQPLPARHGGLRSTIDVWEDGRTIITDHRTRRRQVIPGYCTHCVDAVSAAVDDLLRDIR